MNYFHLLNSHRICIVLCTLLVYGNTETGTDTGAIMECPSHTPPSAAASLFTTIHSPEPRSNSSLTVDRMRVHNSTSYLFIYLFILIYLSLYFLF